MEPLLHHMLAAVYSVVLSGDEQHAPRPLVHHMSVAVYAVLLSGVEERGRPPLFIIC